MRTFPILQQLVEAVAHDNPGLSLRDLEHLCRKRGLSPAGKSSLHLMLAGEKPMPPEHIEALLDLMAAGDAHPLLAVARAAAKAVGGALVMGGASGDAVASSVLRMVGDNSHVAHVGARSLADGRLDDGELRELRDTLRKNIERDAETLRVVEQTLGERGAA